MASDRPVEPERRGAWPRRVQDLTPFDLFLRLAAVPGSRVRYRPRLEHTGCEHPRRREHHSSQHVRRPDHVKATVALTNTPFTDVRHPLVTSGLVLPPAVGVLQASTRRVIVLFLRCSDARPDSEGHSRSPARAARRCRPASATCTGRQPVRHVRGRRCFDDTSAVPAVGDDSARPRRGRGLSPSSSCGTTRATTPLRGLNVLPVTVTSNSVVQASGFAANPTQLDNWVRPHTQISMNVTGARTGSTRSRGLRPWRPCSQQTTTPTLNADGTYSIRFPCSRSPPAAPWPASRLSTAPVMCRSTAPSTASPISASC